MASSVQCSSACSTSTSTWVRDRARARVRVGVGVRATDRARVRVRVGVRVRVRVRARVRVRVRAPLTRRAAPCAVPAAPRPRVRAFPRVGIRQGWWGRGRPRPSERA